jgi:hypothetical protein
MKDLMTEEDQRSAINPEWDKNWQLYQKSSVRDGIRRKKNPMAKTRTEEV